MLQYVTQCYQISRIDAKEKDRGVDALIRHDRAMCIWLASSWHVTEMEHMVLRTSGVKKKLRF